VFCFSTSVLFFVVADYFVTSTRSGNFSITVVQADWNEGRSCSFGYDARLKAQETTAQREGTNAHHKEIVTTPPAGSILSGVKKTVRPREALIQPPDT
jgi:hypothetical protein